MCGELWLISLLSAIRLLTGRRLGITIVGIGARCSGRFLVRCRRRRIAARRIGVSGVVIVAVIGG